MDNKDISNKYKLFENDEDFNLVYSGEQIGPVTVLGITFENEEDRRNYFREELRRKLPELRNLAGFPIAEDEDIITLSDPPYYTACPDPLLIDFLQ